MCNYSRPERKGESRINSEGLHQPHPNKAAGLIGNATLIPYDKG
jgi:hypothetical protein